MRYNSSGYRFFIIIFSILFSLVIVPSQYKIYPIILAFLALIFQKNKKFDIQIFISGSLLYFGLLISLLYSKNIKYGSSFVFETQLLLLIFPLFFAFIPDNFYNIFNRKKNLFFCVYILTVLFYSLLPFYWYFPPHNYNLKGLLYHYPGIMISPEFEFPTIHPIYMAVSIGWSIILSLYVIQNIKKKICKIILIIIDVYFIFILLHLAKMGAIIGLIISIFFYIIFYKYYLIKKIFPIFIITIAFLFVMPNTKKRINEIFNLKNEEILKNTSSGKHYRIFKSGLKIFVKSPLIGYGLGSHKDQLLKQYKKEKQEDLWKNKLSSHNQYLSFLLIGGILLFVIYIVMIIKAAKIAYETKNYLMLIFLIYFNIVMFFENFLERNIGVFVFALFFNFLNWLSFKNKKFINNNFKK